MIEWDANVGLRGTRFPALDIDCTDAELTVKIRKHALYFFGPAPSRVGSPPKELLVYRTSQPFSRVAVELPHADGGGKHLVEFLGHGRQYLVWGGHPSGRKYEWLRRGLWQIPPHRLAEITPEQVEHFLDDLAEMYGGTRVGRASSIEKASVPQEELLAPSREALINCVAQIPNVFEERDDYVMFGCAVKAAAGEDEELGYDVFAEWAGRWEGGNDPTTVRSDWRRMHPPFRVGWSWLVEQAGSLFCEAQYVFEADPDYDPPPAPELGDELFPVDFTDDWVAEQILPGLEGKLRYDYPNDRWHVWDGSRWAHATMGEHERTVLKELRTLGRKLRALLDQLPEGSKKRANTALNSLGNSGRLTAVSRILQSDPRLVVGTDAFDTNPWELNTTEGTVDLTTGELRSPDADAMHSKSTSVAPASGAMPTWDRFLREVTRDDDELTRYMQKLAGYCLTGSTREQTLNFVWGPGGNGKGVFLRALDGVMGEYAATAPMDSFASSKGDKHPTDLAGLMGARLVTSTETQAGRSWDEQRVKALTGGDKIRARFMRQDFVEFQPRFKLVISGNHEPQIENVDEAMRRRIHIIPFTFKPAVRDLELDDRLEAEWPQILRWAIEGALLWQQEGLEPPEAVLAQTQAYFAEEDLPRQWIDASCELAEGPGTEVYMTRPEAFASWRVWCMEQGEEPGKLRDFSKRLRPLEGELGFADGMIGPKDRRRRGWAGIRLIDNDELVGAE
jgi:putative DNA primase/helicase